MSTLSKLNEDLTTDFFTYDNDNDNDKPIKSLLKSKGLLPPVGLARGYFTYTEK
jgi:hypothetical protein